MSMDQTSVTAIMARNVEMASDDQNIQTICEKMYEKKIGSIIIVEEELFDESKNISFQKKYIALDFSCLGWQEKMAEQQMKPVASLLLLLNFCMYAIVLGIGAWSMNKAISHGFPIGI